MGTFFSAMARHPLVQTKAQQEIGNLIGGQRLPNYGDRASLPYVEALFREVMRWRPALPLGVAHSAWGDDIYNGCFIPKLVRMLTNLSGVRLSVFLGTIVYANIWYNFHNIDFVVLVH